MARPPTVSIAAIVEAALAIIDEEGASALTMRAIASRLGVDAAALYYHFKNKEAVLDAVIDTALGDLTVPADGSRDLESSALEAATRYVMALLRHPNLVTLVAARKRPFSLPIYDHYIAGMEEIGVPPQLRAPLIDAMEGFVIGWALFTMNQHHRISDVDRKFVHVREAWRADSLDSIERFRQVAKMVIDGLLSGAAQSKPAPSVRRNRTVRTAV